MNRSSISIYFSWHIDLGEEDQICLSYVSSIEDLESIRESRLHRRFLNKEDMRANLEAAGISDVVFVYPTPCNVTLSQLERLRMPIPIRYIDKRDGTIFDRAISAQGTDGQIFNAVPNHPHAHISAIREDVLPVVVEFER
jgi:hypothetical protein